MTWFESRGPAREGYVILMGETGTGRSRLADALHKLDCIAGAIPARYYWSLSPGIIGPFATGEANRRAKIEAMSQEEATGLGGQLLCLFNWFLNSP